MYVAVLREGACIALGGPLVLANCVEVTVGGAAPLAYSVHSAALAYSVPAATLGYPVHDAAVPNAVLGGGAGCAAVLGGAAVHIVLGGPRALSKSVGAAAGGAPAVAYSVPGAVPACSVRGTTLA